MYYSDYMTKYMIIGVVTGSKHIGVFEASSKEEAEKMAYASEGVYVSLCHACSSECEDAEIQKLIIEEVE